MLYYYCLDCGKAYCKTCFVFFGDEKDKHNGHSIIEYEKYKNMSFPLLKKNTDKLEKNIEHIFNLVSILPLEQILSMDYSEEDVMYIYNFVNNNNNNNSIGMLSKKKIEQTFL